MPSFPQNNGSSTGTTCADRPSSQSSPKCSLLYTMSRIWHFKKANQADFKKNQLRTIFQSGIRITSQFMSYLNLNINEFWLRDIWFEFVKRGFLILVSALILTCFSCFWTCQMRKWYGILCRIIRLLGKWESQGSFLSFSRFLPTKVTLFKCFHHFPAFSLENQIP